MVNAAAYRPRIDLEVIGVLPHDLRTEVEWCANAGHLLSLDSRIYLVLTPCEELGHSEISNLDHIVLC